MKQVNARKLILEEWHKLPLKEQTEQNMFVFWSTLRADKHPAFEFRCAGDPWQLIATWLQEDIHLNKDRK
jgi:hypothetical protein